MQNSMKPQIRYFIENSSLFCIENMQIKKPIFDKKMIQHLEFITNKKRQFNEIIYKSYHFGYRTGYSIKTYPHELI